MHPCEKELMENILGRGGYIVIQNKTWDFLLVQRATLVRHWHPVAQWCSVLLKSCKRSLTPDLHQMRLRSSAATLRPYYVRCCQATHAGCILIRMRQISDLKSLRSSCIAKRQQTLDLCHWKHMLTQLFYWEIRHFTAVYTGAAHIIKIFFSRICNASCFSFLKVNQLNKGACVATPHRTWSLIFFFSPAKCLHTMLIRLITTK